MELDQKEFGTLTEKLESGVTGPGTCHIGTCHTYLMAEGRGKM